MQYQAYQQNADLEEPDRQFLVVAIDLLSGLVQGLGMTIGPFLESCQPPLLTLLPFCLKVSPLHTIHFRAQAL